MKAGDHWLTADEIDAREDKRGAWELLLADIERDAEAAFWALPPDCRPMTVRERQLALAWFKAGWAARR